MKQELHEQENYKKKLEEQNDYRKRCIKTEQL